MKIFKILYFIGASLVYLISQPSLNDPIYAVSMPQKLNCLVMIVNMHPL